MQPNTKIKLKFKLSLPKFTEATKFNSFYVVAPRPPSGWCCFPSNPLGGATFLLSSVWRCCLAFVFGKGKKKRVLVLLLFSCGAGIHGDVFNVHTEAFRMDTHGGEGRREGGGEKREGRKRGRRQFRLPKFAHVGLSRASDVHQKKPLNLAHFQFENKSNTARSGFL